MTEELADTIVKVEFASNDLDADTLLEVINRRTKSLNFWISDYQIIQNDPRRPICTQEATNK